MTTEYKFSKKYTNVNNIEKFSKLIKTDDAQILEVGTFEGRTTLHFYDKFCSPTKGRVTTVDFRASPELEHNLNVANNEQIEFIQGNFYDVLPRLLTDGKMFDLIYIDGGKCSKLFMFQAMICWQMLNINGVLYIDDYTWGDIPYWRPREGIDALLELYDTEIKLIYKNSQVAVQKKAPEYTAGEMYAIASGERKKK
jgi:predicted O-methyltransferase YrrM